jgi:diguanylate cyclase (GGDEF)-like protein/PAS domain S-box-containing protein
MPGVAIPTRALAFSIVATGAACGLGIGLASWPQEPARVASMAALTLAALVTSVLVPRQADAADRSPMPLSFVIAFASLLLLGPEAMAFIATAAAIASGLAASRRVLLSLRGLLRVATVALATETAGFAYSALGGTTGPFEWPWQGAPVAAAVAAYCLVTIGLDGLVAPRVTREPRDRWWPARALRGSSSYVIGAAIAVAVVAAIGGRAWGILSVAAVPLCLACWAYGAHLRREDCEDRRREVMASLDRGVAVVDGAGRITLWNDALARLLACRPEQALGRSITDAVPALTPTELPDAIVDAMKTAHMGVVRDLVLTSAAGDRVVQVDILPDGSGAMLLWHDVTGHAALRQDAERLALAVEGANDGLWSWGIRSQEFYVSARWRAIVGLPPRSGTGSREDWLGRVHPDDVVSLKEAFDAHLAGRTPILQHEHRIRHEDGTYRWCLCRALTEPGANGRAERLAGSLTDITERAAAQERIRDSASRDALTGLVNRSVFVQEVGKRLAFFIAHHRELFAVLYLDLDRFKVVNDNLGHLVGDELLIAVSRRLERCLRPVDAIARLGGDEFAILLGGLGDDTQANAIAFRIQEALSTSFSVGGREVFTSASIGIACVRPEYTNSEEIMRDADTAMYHAKSQGKARHELFDADMHARALGRLSLENDLRQAVTSHALEVYYQPIVLLNSARCTGFEALLRWSRDGKMVSPADFIPIAEDLGLIDELGAWVLRKACVQFVEWQRRYPGAGLDYITVNVSARQLRQPDFVRIVEQTVEDTGIRPEALRLEITETALMGNPRDVANMLHSLREFGVKIYLDDFGTGYSSLSHLHKLPVDALKIDRSFVRTLLLADGPSIVESIMALARTLNTGVVAEGVECEPEARELERLGCRYAQGFFFSRPLPAESIDQLLAANKPLGKRDQKDKEATLSFSGQIAEKVSVTL